ncbi:MAG: AmmeMemoRadiSam system protein A [Anaerolineales bacterium]|nr:AmmeMemoRadiSam system protein A [Anaerolineales bacterium]
MMPVNHHYGEESLTEDERRYLLSLARRALENGVRGEPPPALQAGELTDSLRQMGASFVTLTRRGMLRGCVGALEPYQGLAEDVREHAVAAALEDYRFPPVQADELPEISIEISRLTVPKPLEYENAQDMLSKLRPGVDGVVLRDGYQRATFLPQVWEKIPHPADFLGQLCQKMGAAADLWKRKKLEVLVYQVEEFEEED